MQEQGVAAGVRRIEALTGESARRWLLDQAAVSKALADHLNTPVSDVASRVATLEAQRRQLEKEFGDAKRQLAMGGGSGGGAAAGPRRHRRRAGSQHASCEGVGGKDLRPIAEEVCKKADPGRGNRPGRIPRTAKAAGEKAVTGAAQGRFNAVELAKVAVVAMGGQGAGGRPDFAQGGAPDGAKAAEDGNGRHQGYELVKRLEPRLSEGALNLRGLIFPQETDPLAHPILSRHKILIRNEGCR